VPSPGASAVILLTVGGAKVPIETAVPMGADPHGAGARKTDSVVVAVMSQVRLTAFAKGDGCDAEIVAPYAFTGSNTAPSAAMATKIKRRAIP
jgi:hypothetical protein